MATMIAPTRWRQIVLVDRATLPLLTPHGAAGDRSRYRLTEEPAVRVEVRGRLADAIDDELEAHIVFDSDPGDGPGADLLAGLPTPRVDLDVSRHPTSSPVVPPLVLSGLLRRLVHDARERLADETGPHRPRTYGRHRRP
jgi:hypothetical protein